MGLAFETIVIVLNLCLNDSIENFKIFVFLTKILIAAFYHFIACRRSLVNFHTQQNYQKKKQFISKKMPFVNKMASFFSIINVEFLNQKLNVYVTNDNLKFQLTNRAF